MGGEVNRWDQTKSLRCGKNNNSESKKKKCLHATMHGNTHKEKKKASFNYHTFPYPTVEQNKGAWWEGGKKRSQNLRQVTSPASEPARLLGSTAIQRFVSLPLNATPSNNLTASLEPWPNLSSLALKASQLVRWRRWTQKQEKKLQLLQKYSVVKNTKELAVNIYILYIYLYIIYM